MRTELLKLRTTRTPLALLAAALTVVAAGVSGLFVSGNADVSDPVSARLAIAHAGLVSIFSLILGILAVAGEYQRKTITDTYLSKPRRGRVVAEKVGVYTAAGALFGIASSLTALVVTAIWLAAKGGQLDLGSTGVWSTVAGCVVWDAFFAAVGVGIGALVRNVVAAIAAALAWLALIEGIVGQLLGDFGRWLPFRSGQALEGVATPGTNLLPQWGGAMVLAAYAAIFVLVATSTTVRRDVS